MKYQKYYDDIKRFPDQFAEAFEIAKGIRLKGNFKKFTICGMGGSSLYVELISDYMRSLDYQNISIAHCRSYNLPQYSDNKTLYIIASYSGNTEETISCFKEVQKRGFKSVVISSGGELTKLAQNKKLPLFVIPTGIQPRLSSGYFMAFVLSIIRQTGGFKFNQKEILKISGSLEKNLNESSAKKLAKNLKNKIPIIYSTDINRSIARISKIKFNENSKVQSFWNYFPELNHNEMVGFTKLLMRPYFIIFQSKFTHPRNIKRIKIFVKIMHKKGLKSEIIKMNGQSILEEILNAYYFIDHVTYYLALEYNIDPEPVSMVEEFKELLK